MGYNEVEVIRKLEEVPTQISILDLVLSSEYHRRILVKVLEKTHLPKTVDIEKFSHLIGHILDCNVISFIDDDIPAEGTGHRNPYISGSFHQDMYLGGVQIDGGLTLNICPYDTLERMNINLNRIRSNHVVVRAFNGSRRDTVGKIELPIEIGPYTFDVSFQVLNITTSYNLLLGRLWIRMTGAVPSTIH